MRDDQDFSTDIKQRAVHLVLVIFEDAQMDNFISQGLHLNPGIALPYSKQHQKSPAYLAEDLIINSDMRFAYSL
ncbi:MAG: hypothetical protein NVS3B14_05150 [Ktedonobacteraceae bacterium]